MTTKPDGLLADEAPLAETDEFQALLTQGQERGFLTFEEIAATLEEVEVTKEQLAELHGHLVEQGIDVVSADGKPLPAPSESSDGSTLRSSFGPFSSSGMGSCSWGGCLCVSPSISSTPWSIK